MPTEKIFVPASKATEKVFSNGDYIVNLSLKCEEFAKFMDEHQRDGWINIQVKKMRDPKNGKTHYIELNTFAKQGFDQMKKAASAPASGSQGDTPPESDDQKIPF